MSMKVEAISNGKKIDLSIENCVYSFKDIKVMMYPGGEICIRGKSTPLEYIVIEYSENLNKMVDFRLKSLYLLI